MPFATRTRVPMLRSPRYCIKGAGKAASRLRIGLVRVPGHELHHVLLEFTGRNKVLKDIMSGKTRAFALAEIGHVPSRIYGKYGIPNPITIRSRPALPCSRKFFVAALRPGGPFKHDHRHGKSWLSFLVVPRLHTPCDHMDDIIGMGRRCRLIVELRHLR
jgi:hypothetical protein